MLLYKYDHSRMIITVTVDNGSCSCDLYTAASLVEKWGWEKVAISDRQLQISDIGDGCSKFKLCP